MKKLNLLRRGAIWSLAALLVITACDATGMTAAISVSATSSGFITSTQLARTNFSLQLGQCTNGTHCDTGHVDPGCSPNLSHPNNTWSVGQFAVLAGTHTYNLNISSSTNAASLDQMLCGGGTGKGCSVCVCTGDSSTATTNGNCTASTGAIIPTCDVSGHVTSVTSNLTLTCP